MCYRDTNYGQTISNIRKSKNITVKDVICGTMTKASYSRFVSGKSRTSLDNFLCLLNNLHITFDEFLCIHNGYSMDQHQELLLQIQSATHNHNIEKLKDVLDNIRNICSSHEYDESYKHLACCTQLIIDRLSNNSFDSQARQIIVDYLFNNESWTHYELALFNNVMFIFSDEEINLFYKRVIHNVEKYQSLRIYGSEAFRILTNALMLYIDRRNIKQALTLITEINKYDLKDDMLFEKTLKNYFNGIIKIIRNDRNGILKIQNSLNILKELNSDQYYSMLKKYYNHVCDIYNSNSGLK